MIGIIKKIKKKKIKIKFKNIQSIKNKKLFIYVRYKKYIYI